MANLTYNSYYLPKGREVFIFQGKENIFKNKPNFNDIHLLYDDEFALRVSSEYASLVSTKSSNLLSLLSGSIEIFGKSLPSGQFALQGFKIWESTSPLSISIDVTLNMVTSGKLDVVDPTLFLIGLTVPSKTERKDGKEGWGLVPPGPNLSDILSTAGLKMEEVSKNNIVDIKDGRGLFTLQVGEYLSIPDMVITKAEPTFSKELDEDYTPISCKLSLDFETVEVVTTDMLAKMINALPNN